MTNKFFSNKKIGIVSGAGPIAGLKLLEMIIKKLQDSGCWKDWHFPEIILHNFPFSEMLEEPIDKKVLSDELFYSINFLNNNGCDEIYIACQTLHLFIDQRSKESNVISLFDLIRKKVDPTEKYAVIASFTSCKNKLHKKLLPELDITFLDPIKSQKAIDEILKGHYPDLSWVAEEMELAGIEKLILGCTEFSTKKELLPSNIEIIDPFELVTNQVVQELLEEMD